MVKRYKGLRRTILLVLITLTSVLITHNSIPLVFSHIGGGPPFLKINGRYAQTNPIYQGNSFLSIPQDLAPEGYLLNVPVHFEVDTTQLLFPPDITAKATFSWEIARGDNFEKIYTVKHQGKTLSFTFTKTGSYLLFVSMNLPDSTEVQIIDTVQLDILPNLIYKKPSVKVVINDSKLVGKFTSNEKIDPSASAATYLWDFDDGEVKRGKQYLYVYPTENFYSLIYARVVDSNGIVTDVGFDMASVGYKHHFDVIASQSAPFLIGTSYTNLSKKLFIWGIVSMFLIPVICLLFSSFHKKKQIT